MTQNTFSHTRRWQQSGARRGWSKHEELQQQAWLRVLQGRTSFSRVAPCRCSANASARSSTTVSPSTGVRKAETEGAECSRPCFSEPRRDCDRGADSGCEVGGCHRGFGRGRSSGAQSQGIIAGSHRRDKALHREVKEVRWCIARGSQLGPVARAGDPGQVGFGGKCPSRWSDAVADFGAGSPRNTRTTPDSSSGFCTRIGAIESLCVGTHTGEGRSPIRIVNTWFVGKAEKDQSGRSSSRSRAWRHSCGGHQSEQSWPSIKSSGRSNHHFNPM